jgi:hypothetical protein
MKITTEEQLEDISMKIDRHIDYGFDSSYAACYGALIDDNSEVQVERIMRSNDIYDLIEKMMNDRGSIKSYDMFTFTTCGWAAPVSNDNEVLDENGEEVAPSAHPKRRRVKLYSNVTPSGMISSLISFEDDPDDIAYNSGNQSGRLHDAFVELIKDIQKNNN